MNKKIWCYWSDLNNISKNRKNCLDILKNNCGVDLELVTNKSFVDYQINNFPIHKGFYYLSDTHKSDYARAYLAYCYGGGYSDVKPYRFNWSKHFELLADECIELVGRAEVSPDHIASKNDECLKFYNKLVSVCCYIIKKQGKISTEWINKVHILMDLNYDKLKQNPGHYHPRAVNKLVDHSGVFQPEEKINLTKTTDYPIGWNDLAGGIFHDLQFKYLEKIKQSFPCEIYYPHQYR